MEYIIIFIGIWISLSAIIFCSIDYDIYFTTYSKFNKYPFEIKEITLLDLFIIIVGGFAFWSCIFIDLILYLIKYLFKRMKNKVIWKKI